MSMRKISFRKYLTKKRRGALTDEDTRVSRHVSTGEFNGGWFGGACPSDLELEAGHVELCSAYTASDVEGYYCIESQ